MATGWGSAGAGTALDATRAAYTWIKLHVGDPGSAGTANAATETTRKQATWGTVTSGAFSNTAALDWTSVAGSEDYTHWTCWTASTAGTFGFSGTLTANPVTTGDNFSIAIGDLDVAVTLAS